MQARNPWAVYTALLFGTFITIEAAAFQAPALPSITRDFGIQINLGALIIIMYSLALTVFAPIMGKLGDQYGRKRVLTIGMLIFAVSEFIAAWAPNFWIFLGARFLQGFGAACILPGVFAYVAHLFPANQRGLALGILSFTMTFGASSGGLLGGLLIDRLGWPSIYWISGLLTVIGLLPVRFAVPEIERSKEASTFDRRGAALLFVTISALLSLPTWATNFGRASIITWAIILVGIGSLLLLWRHCRRASNPVIDLDILTRRAFGLPSLIYWLHMIFSSGIIYPLAFFINNRPGGSASQFGFVTLSLFGSALLSSPIAGRLIDRVDPRRVSIFAMALSAVGTLFYLSIDVTTSLWTVIAIASLLGVAIGCNTPAAMKMALTAVPAGSVGAGSGLFSMFRDLGSPTGSSLSLAVFGAAVASQTAQVLGERTAALGLDAASLQILAQAAGSRARELPAELVTKLADAGLPADELLVEAASAGLDIGLKGSGYLLLGLSTLALLLTFKLERQAPTGPASASS